MNPFVLENTGTNGRKKSVAMNIINRHRGSQDRLTYCRFLGQLLPLLLFGFFSRSRATLAIMEYGGDRLFSRWRCSRVGWETAET